MAKKFKKIEIVETNNDASSFLYSGGGVFPILEEKYLKKLRSYVEKKNFKITGKTELEEVLNALKWVTAQWKHDGMNQPPADFNSLDILKAVHEKSERYRCVEYGMVLSEVLLSIFMKPI